MVRSLHRRIPELPRFLAAWAMVAVFAFPLMQELLPRSSAQTMSCCRTKKSCCCKKSAKPNDGRTAFRLQSAKCEQTCQGTLSSSVHAVDAPRTGIQSAPPLPLQRAAYRSVALPPSHDPDPRYGRPPPAHTWHPPTALQP